MPVREEAWKWPRDLHPFFRQNLPEGFLLDPSSAHFVAALMAASACRCS
jgi:hypothetical protein